MNRPGRPEKYRPDQWEHCRDLARKGYAMDDVAAIVGIPRGTLTHRRWLETQQRTHNWGHTAARKGPKPKYARRCAACEQVTRIALDQPCPHCGHLWQEVA